jgi:hypothetical protein
MQLPASPVRPAQRDVMFGGEPSLCRVAALTVSDGMVNYIGNQPNLKNGPFAPLARANASSPSNSHQPRPHPLYCDDWPTKKESIYIARQGGWIGKNPVR